MKLELPTSTRVLPSTNVREREHALRAALFVLAGTLLLALSARIQVPMWPVPMTMQSLAVLTIGIYLGARLGALTVAVYLVQGALGLPVFAGGGGVTYLTGPTAGYLFAFVAAAGLAGWLADRGSARAVPGALLTALAATALVHVGGAAWLSLGVGVERAIAVGVLPFLVGDLVKAVILAIAAPALIRLRTART